MDVHEVNVLGSFRMNSGGQALTDAATEKARALLTFLAFEGAQPRTTLSALLWPYLPQEAASDNLRKTLYRLRQRVEESIPSAADLFIAGRQSVQLDPHGIAVDAVRFQSLLAECHLHAHKEVAACDGCLVRLADAVDLYQGELLAGFGLGDAPAFEEWLLLRRETLQQQVLFALATLTTAWEARGDFARAHAYCSHSLALDPLREETHCQAMRLLQRLGRRSQALQQYESCRRLLREELGVEPDPATVALYEQIRRGDFQRGEVQPSPAAPQALRAQGPASPIPAASLPIPNTPYWVEAPETGRIFGREAELAQLQHWLSTERCQLVTILGSGGAGKTTLAAVSARAVAEDFDQVIWCSLLNAPPLDELLRGVLQGIFQHFLVELPRGLDEQLTLLLKELRRQRCLLVFDNLESILQAEGTGQMRAGYEGYAQVIRRLAENRHNSALLLTSRERPHGLARLEVDLPWVRSLQVEGLDATAGQAILTAGGLSNLSADGEALVARYSGHPLALKLVALTIQELFAGDIAAFLASDVFVFDDIRRVLDEQFARLSELEREILIWLAIEREATSLETLRNNLLRSAASQAVVEAVRSLQRRSLLEKSGGGVALQNVIIEYTTAYLVEQVCQEIAQGSASAALASSSFLNRFALFKAQAKGYVRQSQARLILQPLAERLRQRLGSDVLQSTLAALLEGLRSEIARSPGYAGGNLFNLIRKLGFNLAEYDFSQLNVWQADFRDLLLVPINLAYSDLSRGAFTLTYDLQAIKMSAGGQVLVTGVVDGAICLWRAAGGQLHHTFRSDDTNASPPVIISQDGQWLVSGGVDHTVRIWSAENGACLHTFAGHTSTLHQLAMSGDGRLVASSSYDGTIRIWDVHRGQVRHTLKDHANGLGEVAFHPDGMILAGAGDRTIYLWDIESGRLLQTLNGHAREIRSLAFSGDGRLLVSGAHDGMIFVWEVASGQCLRTIAGHSHIVRTLLVHSDSRLLASGSADRLARLWDLQSGKLLHTFIGHTHEVRALSFSGDGAMLASGGIDNVVHIWDTQSGHALDSLKAPVDNVHTVRFDCTGNLLASCGVDGLVWLWQLSRPVDLPATHGWRGEVVKVLQGHGGDVYNIAFHPNGRWLATGGGDHLIQLWDVESGESIRTLRGHTNWLKSLAFSPDGRWLASGSTDRTIRLWPMGDVSAAQGEGSLVLHGHDDDIDALAFSPDGRTLASGSLDHTVRLWSIEDGRELHVLRGHHHAVSGVAYSVDGELLVTSSYGYDTFVWDAHSGEPSERWRDQAVAALAVAFHANGELCACVAAAQTIEIRHAATGALLRSLPRHTNHIQSLAFSPTEPILVTSGWDSAIWLWNAETGACLNRLRSPGPYTGMNITGVTGITEAQKEALKVLGARAEGVEREPIRRGALLPPDAPPVAPTDRPVPPVQIGQTPALAATPSPPHPQSPFHPQSYVPEYSRIYGRQYDLERLTHWLTQDRCRVIALLGMGGIGKTTLAAAAVHAVASHFEITLWRSLINSPPLDEILHDWLKILSSNALAPLPESLDAQLAQLADCLRQRRCLLVLDNLESIFRPDQAGQMRPERQGYAQLIQRVGELHHQSCLLLTSREYPATFARLEDDLAAVRSLQLEGLDMSAAHAMFQDRGLAKAVASDFSALEAEKSGKSAGVTSLVTLYSGNPLALKLVAETVRELFGGDIEAFLSMETVIFEGIRAVLDWHFERLSELEQEIMLWLAIEREPRSLQALRDNLAPARPAREVLAALQGLRRRSLLDQVATGGASTHVPAGEIRFALQNVLMEYLTDRLIEIAYQEIEQEKLLHLHRHALIKAQASEYVRQSQMRLILHPLVERLRVKLGKEEAIRKIGRILAGLHREAPIVKGYGAGNLLNLLLTFNVDLTGYDFSGLPVWQAELRHANLPAVTFARADLSHTYFAEDFGYIYAVAYSPDGSLLAAGLSSGEIRLWHASDGRLLHIFQGHKGAVKAVAFSPDGALLASGGEDETVGLWRVGDNGEFLRALKGHEGRVTAVAFHPDGKSLASGGVDKTVRLWDVDNGALRAVLSGHEHWIWTIAFDPSGALLASAGYDRAIRLWDVQKASARGLLTGHTDVVSGLVFAAGGAQLASSSFDGTVRLWDVARGQLLQTVAALPDEINAIAISPTGEYLAYGGDDNAAHIWDLQRGVTRHLLSGHDSDILTLAFSPDGQTLATGGSDQSLRLWDVEKGRLRQMIIGYSQSIRMLAYHPNGKLVATAHYDHVVRLWNTESRSNDPTFSPMGAEKVGKIEQLLQGHTKPLQAVTFSNDGGWLASGGDDQTILVWRLNDPDFPAMGAENSGKIAPGRAQRRHLLYSQHGRVTALAFSPDGAMLVSGGFGPAVCVWEVESGKLRKSLTGHDAPVAGIHFSPDGSLLAVVSRSQKLRLWETHTGTLLQVWRGHEAFIYAVAFTPDGQTLATAGGDGVICLWDVRAPTQPRLAATLRGHSDRVFAIAFSADGRRLVSSSADRTVAVWDMQSWQRIRIMQGHIHLVWAVGISPDGKQVASGGPDETLRLWDAESGACLAVLTGAGPYAGMNISEVTGISPAQKTTLIRLGAVDMS